MSQSATHPIRRAGTTLPFDCSPRPRSRDLAAHTRRADVIIAAAGRPGPITADAVRRGVVIVDAGFTPGAVAPDAAAIASAASAVPGGIGPMTIAILLSQTVDAAEVIAG